MAGELEMIEGILSRPGRILSAIPSLGFVRMENPSFTFLSGWVLCDPGFQFSFYIDALLVPFASSGLTKDKCLHPWGYPELFGLLEAPSLK